MKTIFRNILFAFAGFLIFPHAFADDSAAGPNAAVKQWVAMWGEKWWERYHKDYEALYPGGRSNRYHDLYVAEAVKRIPGAAIGDWEITHKQYLYDGDWFAVEWLYQSTQTATGHVQRESTLAFGNIQDDKLILWVEYFDDMVGQYQWLGAMPLFGKDEKPFPWPEKSPLKRKYRP